MEKATIVYGHRGSGKHEKAEVIIKQYKHPFFLYSNEARMDSYLSFLFHGVTEQTDLIVIEVRDDHDFEFWFPLIGHKMTVHTKGKRSFIRNTPKLLFIIEKKPEDRSASFERRFELIECNRPVKAYHLYTDSVYRLPEETEFKTAIYVLQRPGVTVVKTKFEEFILDPNQEVIISNQ